MGATTVIAAAAVASAGVGIYSAVRGSKAPKEIPPPSPPASYYYYDEDGNPSGEHVWDPEKNAYIYRPAPLTEEQKAERRKRQEIRNQMLANLSATPEDRVRAYEEYARIFSDVMQKDVNRRYQDMVRASEESMEARGMTGSRAYADLMAQLARDKQETDIDIAERAAIAKEQLAAKDREYWLNVLANLDAGRNSEYILALQRQKVAEDAAQAGTAGLMARYNTLLLGNLAKWQADIERYRNLSNTFMNTASGLAFLYGYSKNKPNISQSPPAAKPVMHYLSPPYPFV